MPLGTDPPQADTIRVNNRHFIRYRNAGGVHWGEVEGSSLYRLTDAPWMPHNRQPESADPSMVDLVAPVTPGKIVLVGLNYKLHVAESKSATKVPDEPVIFLKPPSSLLGPGEPIIKPSGVTQVDYEAELAVVIGQGLSRPTEREVQDAIFGCTCLNDITARPLQRKDTQWTRAKGFDTFCPVGPALVTGLDYSNLSVRSFLNGEMKQDGCTRDLIFPVVTLIKFIADVMSLYPGDLVSTGTPAGVGPLTAGDEVEIRVEHVGNLKNPVKDESSAR
jgi:2-keto-4-pentenoate hydratase/2-oxohepta-3-ene-1,7-dioic acid hydratase in catechol pathway